jgi:uncharacterized protein
LSDPLHRRLRQLGVVKGFRGLEVQSDTQRVGSEADPRTTLPGERVQTPHGPVWVLRKAYGGDFRHGRYVLRSLRSMPEQGLALIECPDLGAHPAFIDTETTGLAGGTGTLAFLIGVGVWNTEALDLHLIFMRDPQDEVAALYYLEKVLADASSLVSFNGRAFDLPILETRFVLNRMAPGCLNLPHLDLLPLARQLWRDHLSSRRLVVLEEKILDVERSEEDLPSSLIPYLYRQYLESGDPAEMARIFYHNQIDVLSLATLLWHALRLVTEPAACKLSAGEWAGVGRIYDRMGWEARALEAWQFALSGEVGEIADDSAARLWREIGVRHKRAEAWNAARAIWETWTERIPLSVVPLVEQAKYFEWVTKDLTAALDCTERALERAEAWHASSKRRTTLEALRHREARLRRKLVPDGS